MKRARLQEFEYKCIQEEPPWCTAACPLHLDGRGLCRAVGEGKFDEGRKIIERTLPLPGVLGRICDAPCRGACKRREAGGSIELGGLERACLDEGPLRRRPLLIPKSGTAAAVAGCGISSLSAAADGAKKGYSVTVFCRPDKTALLTALSPAVTEEIAREELEWLEKQGVRFRPLAEMPPLQERGSEFSPLYVGLDDPEAALLLDDVQRSYDPVSLETAIPGVFAGGDAPSFIRRAADGRRGMKSVERYLQKASLHSSRETEGPFETRLYTSLKGVFPIPPLPLSEGGYSPSEAKEEAERCLLCECRECVKTCLYLEEYGAYPKAYAREIFNNLSVVSGTRSANRMINSCSLCGRCERICPNGFSMRELITEARGEMVAVNKMPPSAHDFALEDMAFNTSAKAVLARHAPGEEKSGWAFFPGCRLAGSSPGHVRTLYDFLRERLDGGVALWMNCCGAPARWAAREDLFGGNLAALREEWAALGKPVIIAACTSCLEALAAEAPEMRTVSLWEILAGLDLPEGVRLPGEEMALHDPCTSAEMPGVQRAVRALAGKMGIQGKELPLSGNLTTCCGWGGLQICANPALAEKIASGRGGETSRDLLVYCAMCRDAFARTGKRAAHLLDFLFPSGEGDPAAVPHVSFSDQRENRIGLVRELKKTLWKEEERVAEPWESVRLVYPAGMEEKLEERRILASVVQRLILHAEEGNRKIQKPDGTYLASLRPASVTYWAEYLPREDGSFEVKNAWSHRMAVAGAGEGEEP